ncbi:MAG: substrate-binding domain-containing protein [Nitrospirae bacterium]|nr:substrate-binding domain-containing protein [Nitrospirota bacterium]MDA8339124.1 substrate-binding domain-containing protein [Nitrospiraceae bacterium]
MKKYGLVLTIAIAFVLALSIGAFAQEVKVGAGAAPSNSILKPVKEHFEKATGIKFTLIEQGPKLAMQDVLKGTIDAAGAGLTLDEWISMMKKEGIEVNKAELQVQVIGKSRAVVMINKANPVTKLTKEQLKGIFTGKITNWKDVGGKDMPIIIVWAKLTPGMNSLFVNQALDGAAVIKDLLEATTGPDLRQNVASNQEAIGISALSVADDTVKVPEQPEATSDIILVTKGKPSANVQKLIDYIKGEGQKYVKP